MCAVNETLRNAVPVAGKRKGVVRAFVLSAVVTCVAASLLWLVTRYVRSTADLFLREIFMGRAS